MSLSTTSTRNDYTGNASASVFAYSFRIFAQGDLLVKVKKTSDGTVTTLVLTTDYTVSGIGSSSGGNITLVNSSQAWLTTGKLSTGYTLTVKRIVSLVQNADIRNQGSFLPETHENEFDYLTMIDQQQQDQLDRSVRLSDAISPSSFSGVLPGDIVSHPNEVIAINGAGTGLVFRTVLTGSPDYFIQSGSPTSPSSTAIAFWLDTSVNQLKVWKGSSWVTIA